VTFTIPLEVSVRLGGVAAPPTPTQSAEVAFTEAMVEPIHDDDYGTREGYDPEFLGLSVPVPEVTDLLGLDFADDNGTPYPFCAAGLSWATAKSFCDLAPALPYTPETRLGFFRSLLQPLRTYYFRPDARCQTIQDDAKVRGLWVGEAANPKPGWLVLYNWHRQSPPQHIGIVQSADAASLHTIEFNTSPDDGPNQGNGGFVARKNRQPFRWAVLGYVKT
jgi:hypothetical protein